MNEPQKNEHAFFEEISDRWPRLEDKAFIENSRPQINNDLGEREYRLLLGYKRAGDILVRNTCRNYSDYQNLVYPIVFCYRHFIELSIKAIIRKHGNAFGIPLHSKSHKLAELWKTLLDIIGKAYSSQDEEALLSVGSCVQEFDEIDPNSTSFRYSETKEGKVVNISFEGVNLLNLYDIMNGLANFFDCLDEDLSDKTKFFED